MAHGGPRPHTYSVRKNSFHMLRKEGIRSSPVCKTDTHGVRGAGREAEIVFQDHRGKLRLREESGLSRLCVL